MKKVTGSLIIIIFSNFILSNTNLVSAECVIADHSVVALYSQIPNKWIDSVKKMHLAYPGESHGNGLLYGLELLASENPRYAVKIVRGKFPPETVGLRLRVHRARYDNTMALNHPLDSPFRWREGGGEEHMWTSGIAKNAVKAQLDYAKRCRTPYNAYAFCWCWDMCASPSCNPWAGLIYYWSDPNCTGQSCWRSGSVSNWDTSTTQINLQDYLDAWDEIQSAHPDVVMIYTTGPVDGGSCGAGCKGYQTWLKHDYIRRWVKAGERHLFDYADILCWSDAGKCNYVNESGYKFPSIHPDNAGRYDDGNGNCHISKGGCIRLAKAMWWLLARIAGWDGQITR